MKHRPGNQPILKGWVTTFYIQHNGKRLGPYFARCWKENGKRHRQYIKAADLQSVLHACQAHRQMRKAEIQTSKWMNTVLSNFSYLKTIERIIERGIPIDDILHVRRIAKHGLTAEGRPRRRPKRFMGPFSNRFRFRPEPAQKTKFQSKEERDQALEANRAKMQDRIQQTRKGQVPPRSWYELENPEWLTPQLLAETMASVPDKLPKNEEFRRRLRNIYLKSQWARN